MYFFSINLFLFCALFIFNYQKDVGLLPLRTLVKSCIETNLRNFIFITNLRKIDCLRMNKDGFTQISMLPHITFSDILYLPCSTFFPHTKLANTHSVYFHPRLYILFSVLSNECSSFLMVHSCWLSTSKVPLYV